MANAILLAVSESANIEAWVNLALCLLDEGGKIYLSGMITIPENISLSEGTLTAQKMREKLDRMAKAYPEIEDDIHVRVDYRPLARIIEDIKELSISLLLVDWNAPITGGLTSNEILQNAPVDLALISGNTWHEKGPVLLPLRGRPNTKLSLKLAQALAQDSSITLFHAIEPGQPVPDLQTILQNNPKITRMVTARSSIADSLLQEMVGHKALVVGATFYQPKGNTSSAGKVADFIQEKIQTPLVLVRAWQPDFYDFQPLPLIQTKESLSNRVDRWFAENTFNSEEFSDLRALMALKEKQGVTISIGLPALNEEKTVGKVISTIKSTLMDEIPLLDEIVLIDSNSTDSTVAIAEAQGIPTYKHPDILTEMGSYQGKGEALWKSLYVLKGDIVAWIDTDITNIHPRFIYGILGPLLKYPHVQYVKGFYHRPIKVDGILQAYGGGRVTELVARPLLNLFHPELSGVVQPLSGEYAGRRSALEQVPFFSGYGVETGLMIDLHDIFGLDGIAQTDLEQRVHHNQPLVGLSKMSFAILQVFMARLEKRHHLQLLDKANKSMKLIKYQPERLALEFNEISDVERPPMLSLAAYQQREKSLHL